MRFALAVLLAGLAFSQPPSLPVGEPVERQIAAGEIHRFTIGLKANQYAGFEVRQKSVAVAVQFLDPAGKPAGGGGTALPRLTYGAGLVSATAGDYSVEVRALTPGSRGLYSLQLLEVIPAEERFQVEPSDDLIPSPRIARLKADLANRPPGALETFWAETQASGSPLIETLTGDPNHVLVTFLWRAKPGDRNVLLYAYPFALLNYERALLKPLAGTDLLYRTFYLQTGARFTYALQPNAPPRLETLASPREEARFSTYPQPGPDPLNPRKFGPQSFVELPDAPPDPYATRLPGVPAGTVAKFPLKSSILGNERELSVYVPAAPPPQGGYALLVQMDGPTYLDVVSTPAILDNLIAQGKIPPAIGVFIPNPSFEHRYRELNCTVEFGQFLEKELLPEIRRRYPAVSSDPARAVISGSSRAGLMAACTGLRHSHVFGNVLAQSGIVWWDPSIDYFRDLSLRFKLDESVPPNWLAAQFATMPKLPLRFHLDAGTWEFNIGNQANRGILEANRHLRDVLLAKSYPVHYQEFVGGHEYINWRRTLADGLIALLGSK